MMATTRVLNPLLLVPEKPIDVVHIDEDTAENWAHVHPDARKRDALAYAYQASQHGSRFNQSIAQAEITYIVLNHPRMRELYRSSWLISKSGFARVSYEMYTFGVLIHEVAHVMFESLPAWNVRHNLSLQQYDSSVDESLWMYLWNVLEDRRVEYLVATHYPLYAQYLSLVLGTLRQKPRYRRGTPRKTETFKAFDALLQDFFSFVRFGVLDTSEHVSFWEFALPLTVVSGRGTPEDTVRSAFLIERYLYSMFSAKMKQEREEAQKQLQDEQAQNEAEAAGQTVGPLGPVPQNETTEEKTGRYKEKLDKAKELEQTIKQTVPRIDRKQPVLEKPVTEHQMKQLLKKAKQAEEEDEQQQIRAESGSNDADDAGPSMPIDSAAQSLMDSLNFDTANGIGMGVNERHVLHDKTDKFYRSVLEQNLHTIHHLRRVFEELMERRRNVPVYDGDLSLKRQQEAYMGSLIGEGGRDYTLLKKDEPEADVVIFRDISSSTAGLADAYAASTIVILEALNGLDAVRTALVDFNSRHAITKLFDEEPNYRRLYPIATGGTFLTGALQEAQKFDYRNRIRIAVVITDGGISEPESMRVEQKKMEDDLGFSFLFLHVDDAPNPSWKPHIEGQLQVLVKDLPMAIFDHVRKVVKS